MFSSNKSLLTASSYSTCAYLITFDDSQWIISVYTNGFSSQTTWGEGGLKVYHKPLKLSASLLRNKPQNFCLFCVRFFFSNVIWRENNFFFIWSSLLDGKCMFYIHVFMSTYFFHFHSILHPKTTHSLALNRFYVVQFSWTIFFSRFLLFFFIPKDMRAFFSSDRINLW